MAEHLQDAGNSGKSDAVAQAADTLRGLDLAQEAVSSSAILGELATVGTGVGSATVERAPTIPIDSPSSGFPGF